MNTSQVVGSPDTDGAVCDLHEVVAALGAARCATTLPAEFCPILLDAQRDLLDLAHGLPARDGGFDASRAERLNDVRREWESEPPPSEFAEVGGTVECGGLLLLARAIARRASRTLDALCRTSGIRTRANEIRYLTQLSDLLVTLAYEAELRESRIVVSMCGMDPMSVRLK